MARWAAVALLLATPASAGEAVDAKALERLVSQDCGSCHGLTLQVWDTRLRALQLTGDPWAEDPTCYLTNTEIGVAEAERLEVTPLPRQAT
jgi:mono/diheme cytochrome c family protein